MTGNLSGFNAAEVQPQESFEPIPVGDYTAMITDSEMKPTKNNLGEYLQLVFEILEGEYRGRKIFARLNLVNQNQTAVDIAQRELSAICHAVGVMQPQDSTDLHDLPMTIGVKIRPGRGEYGPSNEISRYSSLNGGATKPATAPAAPRKPWER